MAIKDDVLRKLLESESVLSGSALARSLDVSRNAVWKAIEQLRAEGYQIDASTNRGYRLSSGPEALNLPEIGRWLAPGIRPAAGVASSGASFRRRAAACTSASCCGPS